MLRNLYNEQMSGTNISKLIKLFTDIKTGKITRDKLEVYYGFDLNKPHTNTETKVAKILSAWYKGITKEDILDALKELKVKQFEDLILGFNKIKGPKKESRNTGRKMLHPDYEPPEGIKKYPNLLKLKKLVGKRIHESFIGSLVDDVDIGKLIDNGKLTDDELELMDDESMVIFDNYEIISIKEKDLNTLIEIPSVSGYPFVTVFFSEDANELNSNFSFFKSKMDFEVFEYFFDNSWDI